VAKNAIPEYPHLALALGQKLLAVGKRIEAIEVAETALKETKSDGYWTPKCAAREPLLRFLTQACDPETDLERLIGHARTLLFEFSQPADYILVRNLLHGEEEIESLVQEAKSKCTAKALIEILSKEERWKDLMDCAARHTRDDEFPAMIRLLRDRYPEECFRLYRKALWGIVDSGTAKRIYQSAAFHARQMKEIPGHEEALARLMARIVEKYSRRRGLMSALGDLATLGRSWQERMGKERFKKVEAKRPKDIAVDELIERCPVQEKDRARLKSPYVKWHRTHAARVWAVLTAYGGRMEAADLTEALVQHLGCRPTGAGAIRSGGLRLLEALGYVEIHRQGRHLGEVRLTHKTGGTRGEKKA
jgi:hypothetical protein